MPRDPSQMERIQEPLWDTLIQGTPGSFKPNTTITGGPHVLFGSNAASSLSISNMDTPGVLPGNQTYLMLAMRVWLYFKGCESAAGLNDFIMYHHAVLCLYWQLNIDTKRYFVAPTWYLGAGGGLHGDVGSSTDVFFTNGLPSANAIMTLDRPIPLVQDQPFQVQCTVASVGGVNVGTDIDNLTSGEVNIQFVLDGLKLRNTL